MKDEVREEILNLLEQAKDALERGDIKELDELSNHTLHCTTIYGERDSIMIAVLLYALSKLLEKQREGQTEVSKELTSGMLKNIEASIKMLKNKQDKNFESLLKESLNLIKEFDKSYSSYVEEILEFGKVQKGTKIYEHGISLTEVAQLLGISKWELMKKIGERKFVEYGKRIPPSERLKKARRLLG